MNVVAPILLAWISALAVPSLRAEVQDIDAERVRIYRAFVKGRDAVTPWRVNIAKRTSRLDPVPERCVAHVDIAPPNDPGEKGRKLPEAVVEGANAKLIGLGLGRSVYHLSEIAFDRQRRYALLN